MSTHRKHNRNRMVFLLANLGLAGLAVVVAGTGLKAQTAATPDVFRVEEDWQLIVGNPSPNDNGPQVTCTISPLNMNTAYCAFDINYRTQPDYSAGGLQVHTWDPVAPTAFASSAKSGVMSTVGETVTWTQSMAWSANAIQYRVVNGVSTTWGTFGGDNNGVQGDMLLSEPTTLANLNGYSSTVSLDNSGVCFARNFVGSLTLMAVRWYDVSGKLIQQNTTPQLVHPQ